MLPVLNKCEIEEPRSPDRLFAWVRGIYECFGETQEGRSAFRLRQGPLLKEFLDEVWPLASYAHLFYAGREDVLFQPVLGNQSHDALVLDSNSRGVLSHVEITTALDGGVGYQECLRTLHLEQYGHAPLTGAAFARDPATRAVQKVDSDMVAHNEARDAELDQIRQAVHRKADKSYPAGAILVVEFRSLHFSKPEDERILKELVGDLFRAISSKFAELGIVDVPAELGFRYPPRPSLKPAA